MIALADLLADPRRALDLPTEAVPPLLAECGGLMAILAARLAAVTPVRPAAGDAAQGEDRWLTVKQAAQTSALSARWLYANWRSVGGAKKFSPKQLRFHEPSFRRWLSKRS